MLSDFTGADKVFIACGYTDLRRGIDGLIILLSRDLLTSVSVTEPNAKEISFKSGKRFVIV